MRPYASHVDTTQDANNLLCMLDTWQQGDISKAPKYNGDFDKALAAITCKALVMPGQTDLYFPPEDNEYEVSKMPSAVCRAFPSIWGYGVVTGKLRFG